MLKVEIKADPISKSIRPEIPGLLRRTAFTLAKLVNEEAKREIPTRFDLTKKWILQGFTEKIESESPNLVEAVAFTRDAFMFKQEFGTDITPFKGRLALPGQFLRKKARPKPRQLTNKAKYWKDHSGIWERLGQNRKRLWYSFTPKYSYNERLHYREVAQRVVDQDGQRVFDLHFTTLTGGLR